MNDLSLQLGLSIATVLAVAALVLGLWMAGRRRRLDPSVVRWRVLSTLGYTPTEDSVWRRQSRGPAPPRRWTMPVDRTAVTFTELANGGGRWTVNLHQYDMVSLHIQERSEPAQKFEGHPFTSGIGVLDERYWMLSAAPHASIALIHDPKVVRALLEMPWLSLTIRGDQLVIDDVAGHSRERLTRDARSSRARAAAETEVHQRALALILVVLAFFHGYDRDLER